MAHKKYFSFQSFRTQITSMVVAIGVFVIPQVAFAAAVDDYIHNIRVEIFATVMEPGALTTLADALETCLRAPWATHAGNLNWQYHADSAPAVTTVDQLRAVLNSTDANQPCRAEFTALKSARDALTTSQKYPVLVADVRRTFITNGAARVQADPVLAQQFELYSACLMQQTAGAPNWQFGGSAPANAAELQSRLNSTPNHPCLVKRDLVTHHTQGQPLVNPDAPAQEPTAVNQPVVAPTTNNNAVSNNTAVIDNRPIYERLTPPSSQDVLQPSFATSNPSVAGLVNFLFDLFVRRLLPWLVALMVIIMTWAGFNYVMAQGDSAKLKQAKDMILFGIIAMVIAMAALSIITILNNILTNTDRFLF